MKKRLLAALVASAAVLSLAGCNTNNNSTPATSGDSNTSGTSSDTTSSDTTSGDTSEPVVSGKGVDATEEQKKAGTGIKLSDTEGKVFNIAVWNEEWKGFFEKYYTVPEGVTVNFLVTPSEGGAYQSKLDEYLLANETASADEKIDLFLAEADYIKKYANSDLTVDLSTLGINQLKTEYQYTVDAASDVNGTIKGVSFQACPAAVIYRRSIAKDVLGTDDPEKVQEALSSWDKFNEVAKTAKEKGYYMTPSALETYRTFANNSTNSFLTSDNVFQTTDGFDKWLAQAEDFMANGYTIGCKLWADEKSAQMGTEGKTLCFFGPAWYYNFCMGTAMEQTKGDWAICKGPQEYFWGGTWLMAPKGTDNPEMLADIINAFTANEDLLSNLVSKENQFVNNTNVIDKFATDASYGNEFLGGQNDIALMNEVAQGIVWKVDLHTQYDQTFNETLPERILEYLNGACTKDEAFANFGKDLSEKAPTVKVS